MHTSPGSSPLWAFVALALLAPLGGCDDGAAGSDATAPALRDAGGGLDGGPPALDMASLGEGGGPDGWLDARPDGMRPDDMGAPGDGMPRMDAAPDKTTADMASPDMAPPAPDAMPPQDMAAPDMAAADMAPPDPDMAPPEPDMAAPDMAAPGACGDGVLDPDEVCDPAIDGAACRDDCRALCGNGLVEGAELCDAGPDNGPDGPCTARCTFDGACGDGVLQPDFEACDEGDVAPGGFCDPDCRAIERVDPLGFEAWPEGARVRITAAFDLRGDLVIGAGAVVTLDAPLRVQRGTVSARGRPGLPVVFRGREGIDCLNRLVELDGGSLSVEQAVFEHAKVAISGGVGQLEMRASVIRDLCARRNGVVAGIDLGGAAEATLAGVEMRDFVVEWPGLPGDPETPDADARPGSAGPAVYGLRFRSRGPLAVDTLVIRHLYAGAGAAGGAGGARTGAVGGAGGEAVGVVYNQDSRFRGVRVEDLQGGAGGPGGAGGGRGGDGGAAIGLRGWGERSGFDPADFGEVELIDVIGGEGGEGGVGWPGEPGTPGMPGGRGGAGGPGGLPGVVRGVEHDRIYGVRLVNLLAHRLRLSPFGRGGAGGAGGPGGDGAPGGDGGSGGPSGGEMPAPLVGVELGGPATLEHVTLAIDDQLHVRPEDSLGGAPGAPGAGSDAAGAAGRSRSMSGRVILHGLRTSEGRGGPLLNSVVVGDTDPSPAWHETRGIFAVEPEMSVEDSLIWGFDRATLAVLARRIVQDDPLFADRPGGDMRPRPQSPAVGQAAASAVEIDLYGVDRADPATLGALEPRGPEIIGAD